MSAPNHIVGASNAMRKIAPLHRSTLVDYEADRMNAACADANAPDLYEHSPLHIPRERQPAFGIWKALCWVIALVLAIGLVAALWP